MSRPKTRFEPEPRFWNQAQVCARLGIGEETFRKKLPRLERLGFPKFDEVIGGWDSVAIERYFDQRAGLSTVAPGYDFRGAGDGL
jgi:hypothetical protein